MANLTPRPRVQPRWKIHLPAAFDVENLRTPALSNSANELLSPAGSELQTPSDVQTGFLFQPLDFDGKCDTASIQSQTLDVSPCGKVLREVAVLGRGWNPVAGPTFQPPFQEDIERDLIQVSKTDGLGLSAAAVINEPPSAQTRGAKDGKTVASTRKVFVLDPFWCEETSLPLSSLPLSPINDALAALCGVHYTVAEPSQRMRFEDALNRLAASVCLRRVARKGKISTSRLRSTLRIVIDALHRDFDCQLQLPDMPFHCLRRTLNEIDITVISPPDMLWYFAHTGDLLLLEHLSLVLQQAEEEHRGTTRGLSLAILLARVSLERLETRKGQVAMYRLWSLRQVVAARRTGFRLDDMSSEVQTGTSDMRLNGIYRCGVWDLIHAWPRQAQCVER